MDTAVTTRTSQGLHKQKSIIRFNIV
jgi:hypothetical protein